MAHSEGKSSQGGQIKGAAEKKNSPDSEPTKNSEVPPRPPGQYEIYPKSYYEYDLVGIVVHSGNAQAGHYYSLFVIYTSNGDVKEMVQVDDQTVQSGHRIES